MANIAILHEDLEWTEGQLRDRFEERGDRVTLFDIRETNPVDVLASRPDLVLNRVYASVGNRNYGALEATLDILKRVEEEGVPAVNSYDASRSDYSKEHAFSLMKQAGIPTPRTLNLAGVDSLEDAVAELGGYPIIVKRDSGGRGIDVSLCESEKEVRDITGRIADDTNYDGSTLLQTFERPSEARDYRVWVVGGEVLFYHGRSLVPTKEGGIEWLASRSRGSEILPIDTDVPEDLRDFATKAAASIDAEWDVLDVIRTNSGYVVIEHNPTPNLRPEYEGILGFDPVAYVVDRLRGKYNLGDK